MFVIVGMVLVIGGIIVGYAMEHGNFQILINLPEFLILGGAGIGTLLIANPMSTIKAIITGVLGTLKGSKTNKETFMDLLRMMYELFQLAKREGLIGLEQHIENPEGSSLFGKYPTFLGNHHAVDFLCDTLKVVLNGGIPASDLEDMMNLDLETAHSEELKAPSSLNTVGDAMPGLGIVAAVLGVIVTMGKIDQPPEVIGHSVASALVGTFLGILMSYGFIAPLAKNIEGTIELEGKYMEAIKAGILAFVKGAPPIVAIENARRAIVPEFRPSFKETESSVKQPR